MNETENRVTFTKASPTAAERAAQARKDAEDDARFQAALDAPRRAWEREQAEAAARARKAEERAAAAAAQKTRQAAQRQEARNGFQTVEYDNGSVYRGHLKDGKRHGHGTYEYANGNRYVGEWQNGEKHGQGVFTFSTGTVYEGKFEDGKAKGDGEARIRNGNRFKGYFMGAFGDARGTMYFASGAVRRGWVKDGKFYDRNPFPGKANLSRPRRIIRSGENRRRNSVDSQREQTRYEAATLRPGHDAFFTSAPHYYRPGYFRVERSDHFEAVELDTFHLLLLGPEDCWSSVNTWGVARYAGTPDELDRWRDLMERDRNVKVHDTEIRALEIARRDLRKLRSRYVKQSSDPQGTDRRLQIAKHGNLPRDMCDGKFRYQEFDRFD